MLDRLTWRRRGSCQLSSFASDVILDLWPPPRASLSGDPIWLCNTEPSIFKEKEAEWPNTDGPLRGPRTKVWAAKKKPHWDACSVLVSVRVNGRTEAHGHMTVFYYFVFTNIIFIVIFIFSFINRVWKQRGAKMSEWVWLHFVGNIHLTVFIFNVVIFLIDLLIQFIFLFKNFITFYLFYFHLFIIARL